MRVLILLISLMSLTSIAAQDYNGAWQASKKGANMIMIISDGYFSVAVFKEKEFIATYGGILVANPDSFEFTYEFHTAFPDSVGLSEKINVSLDKNILKTQGGKWERLDDGTPGKLPGAWIITGRERNGEMTSRKPGPRKTMKILSGSRFQWIAYNTETKEFMGSGGGTYTTIDGKYTENIDFFSRDNNRVGASLEFDFELKEGNWHHKGLSSKGKPIYEVWSLRE